MPVSRAARFSGLSTNVDLRNTWIDIARLMLIRAARDLAARHCL
jgi:hypothetical protein